MAGKLTPRDSQIAALIASGLTYAETGTRLKLSEKTIGRTMQRAEVRAEVDAIRSRAVETGLGLLTEDFTDAVRALRTLRQSGTGKDATKLNAIKLTIESVLKVREHVTLTREVEELRRMVNEPASGSEPPPGDSGIPPSEPAGSGQPDNASSGPDDGIQPSGHPPGPVAGGIIGEPTEADIASGFASGGQE